MPRGSPGFSILLRIELVFGAWSASLSRPSQASFSILLRIELVFGGLILRNDVLDGGGFSILLRIELVFGAVVYRQLPDRKQVSVSSCGSSWFLGARQRSRRHHAGKVSVSSCGSSWFLGLMVAAPSASIVSFSILLRIELVFGGALRRPSASTGMRFQYPLADRVGFWGRPSVLTKRAKS